MTKTENNTGKAPKRMLYLLLGLAFVIIVFLIMVFPMMMSVTSEPESIKIPSGATEKTVRDTLSHYYGDSFAKNVLRLTRLQGTDWSKRHGAYTIEKGTNALGAARRLSRGAQTPVRITINGFRNLDLLIDRISAKLEFPADSLKKTLADPTTLSPYGLTPQQALALFVDNTYEVYWSSSPREVIDKIGRNYLSLWNDTRRGKARLLGLDPAQVMIVCSIADEETNKIEEKGIVGRLYVNRLQKGMKLQADPTVRFAIGDFTIRRVRNEHLRFESPYNTYLHAGLPPGPIRTTGQETIDALLDSDPHNYLYMCAKDDFSGFHSFAETFSEHSQNALRYRKALDNRGIK